MRANSMDLETFVSVCSFWWPPTFDRSNVIFSSSLLAFLQMTCVTTARQSGHWKQCFQFFKAFSEPHFIWKTNRLLLLSFFLFGTSQLVLSFSPDFPAFFFFKHSLVLTYFGDLDHHGDDWFPNLKYLLPNSSYAFTSTVKAGTKRIFLRAKKLACKLSEVTLRCSHCSLAPSGLQ